VAHQRAYIDNHGARWKKQRRPGWVGQRCDQNIAGIEAVRVRRVEHDAGAAARDAGRAAIAFERLAGRSGFRFRLALGGFHLLDAGHLLLRINEERCRDGGKAFA
jgi:hypothetical protein